MTHRVSNIVNQPKLCKVGTIRLGEKQNGTPTETGHFIIDIESDPMLAARAKELYGEKPNSIDITLYSDNPDDCYRCTYQMWGAGNKGTAVLKCEGNGVEAYDNAGQRKTCPCDNLGKKCRKTTILRFLIPSITMGGYFMLSTRSEHNARVIDTTIQLVQKATGGLVMRPMRLVRTEGVANINGIVTKKYFLSLLWTGGMNSASATIETTAMTESAPAAIEYSQEDSTPTAPDIERVIKGREKVKEKLKEFVKGPFVERALEVYACERYGRQSFNDLTVEDLLDLWRSIAKGNGSTGGIYNISVKLHKEADGRA